MTLHVGLGTFQPIHADDIEAHSMHSSRFRFPRRRQNHRVGQARPGHRHHKRPHPRTLWARTGGEAEGETDIFLYQERPPPRLTSHPHQLPPPDSTLILLVAAFLGKDKPNTAYRHAIEQKYRFYSYGDCMIA
ncbi:MAG: S-adenosylmethionine:tRNA ribosyltransferase-isomerase [Bryobacterales bacterium]